jgi:hypothetical protein
MRLRTRAAALALLVLALAGPPAARATEGGTDLATQALAECKAGRASGNRATRLAHFETGLGLAHRAVATSPRNADAYFARFCNKGEMARIDGESVAALVALGGLLADLDRTLALDPNHAEALASKGILLIRLPRLFGGDQAAGEAMLRRVLVLDPLAFNSRLVLAECCSERGEHGEALGLARRALEIATQKGQDDKIAEARAVLVKLGDSR